MGGQPFDRQSVTGPETVKLKWTNEGLADLTRLHDFMAPANPKAAAGTVFALTSAAKRLLQFPRIGEGLDQYMPREVRHIVVGGYELR